MNLRFRGTKCLHPSLVHNGARLMSIYLKSYAHSITTWPPLRALLSKVCIVKAMVFPVVMYRCESWTIREVECQGTDAFTLWCWRRLSRVPWTARRSNQSILNEISPEYSLQYFGYLMLRTESFEKTLMLGKIEAMRRMIGLAGEEGLRADDEMIGWHQ